MRHSLKSLKTESVRPVMKMTEIVDDVAENIKNLYSPYFPLDTVRDFVMTALNEAVEINQYHNRDPIGGSNENLFLPLIKLVDKLLLVGILEDDDVNKLLIMIDPETWDAENFQKEASDEHRKGLLHMKMAEGARLQMCYLLHHLCDVQLRHRIEAIIAFSLDFVSELQTDQLNRYNEIKQSDLPSAIAAKKTREFRCSPREQMNAILSFKTNPDDYENCPCKLDLREKILSFHGGMMEKVSLNALQDNPTAAEEEEALSRETSNETKTGFFGSRFFSFLNFMVKEIDFNNDIDTENQPEDSEKITIAEELFRKVLIRTIVRWAEESQIETPKLVREMFSLLIRQYDTIGDLIRCLMKTYVIDTNTKGDVTEMWIGLSQIRALLPVQMSHEEEGLMRERLWKLINNHTFFQHPDLIRTLRLHENVMAVMMNTLGRRAQSQSDSSSSNQQAQQQQQTNMDMESNVVSLSANPVILLSRSEQ